MFFRTTCISLLLMTTALSQANHYTVFIGDHDTKQPGNAADIATGDVALGFFMSPIEAQPLLRALRTSGYRRAYVSKIQPKPQDDNFQYIDELPAVRPNKTENSAANQSKMSNSLLKPTISESLLVQPSDNARSISAEPSRLVPSAIVKTHSQPSTLSEQQRKDLSALSEDEFSKAFYMNGEIMIKHDDAVMTLQEYRLNQK